ncbi:NUDIX domain-containing protein [Jannaschia donghaensis]|uniref:NUDIX domain protein n=1 Tax=Jannaschia donghaensis TaxID=420998 RepID=A0A0M6YLX4_9RHOB|nr:NUDIX domain-containing protein [Jannaschia donghaensis]CTQ50046.1 NUDIX domain protein [Jannaschia donghaensis]
MIRAVACPVVRRGRDILAFRHPLAGHQIVKGGIEPGEDAEAAALRELSEEAGIAGAAAWPIATRCDVQPGERWHFFDVTTNSLPERWTHHTKDNGGHTFAFFWLTSRDDLSGFAPRFQRAIEIVRAAA